MRYLARFDEVGKPTALFRYGGVLVEQLTDSGVWLPAGPVDDAAELVHLDDFDARLVAYLLDLPSVAVAA